MKITHCDLDRFVQTVDSLGGPESGACLEYWKDFEYAPRTRLNTDLDPFSEAYVQSQIGLYGEISGRSLDQTANELTDFDIERHVNATNPYGIADPSKFSLHFVRLGLAMVQAKLPPNPRIIDMGAGWGLSSEFFAMLGATVTAIDINPKFIELIARRQRRHGHDLHAVQSAFDVFDTTRKHQAIVFYECLHHCVKPWELIERSRNWLAEGGKFVFAGEPINANWWKHWGLRLDPLSVYCIRKFGWFESGWSREFLTACFARSGYHLEVVDPGIPDVGPIGVATQIQGQSRDFSTRLDEIFILDGWSLEPDHAVSTGRSSLRIRDGAQCKSVVFGVNNFRPAPVKISVFQGMNAIVSIALDTGFNEFSLSLVNESDPIVIESETWIPANEIGNGDARVIGFHLSSITIL